MTEPKEQYADVSAQRLAAVYAEALLNAAEAHQCVAVVLEEVDSIIDDVATVNRKLGALITGGVMGRTARTAAITKAFSGRANDVFFHFLLVLNNHERLTLLRPIRKALHELHDERARRLLIQVYSAIPLDMDFQKRIMAAVHTIFNLDPVLELHHDPSLLGGLKIRIGDKVYDGTVRTRLDNLRNQLTTRSSHEIQTGRDRFSSAE